ncbi:transcription elongation factor GreB [Hydromonas duriensis]|uniref:Transcription elongation factor GreB n=1 Tax=Hydromonas duriensis TaxID=1527608 RepID=A0A4R6YB53_9BURK|nr:transcription elongation factor GreB [Hydromonas duriensis]TDR32819.1 transcription elongation factor GreB [Hydromonas duriensis]
MVSNQRGHAAETVAAPVKNYMTPTGYTRLKSELLNLLDVERPEVVQVVSWAAKNGDRSENGDYLYGKRRLREIDRRVRYLTKALENAQVIDPATQQHVDQIFFGATVTFWREATQVEETISIVGKDEIDSARGWVSWNSPIARAMLKAREGDEVRLNTPAGTDILEIVEVKYVAIE